MLSYSPLQIKKIADENNFITEYNSGKFKPDSLFNSYKTKDVSIHPVAI